jgi:hypothetical protein
VAEASIAAAVASTAAVVAASMVAAVAAHMVAAVATVVADIAKSCFIEVTQAQPVVSRTRTALRFLFVLDSRERESVKLLV